MKFLIISDDKDLIQIVIMTAISNFDVEICEAYNETDALKQVEENSPFDIVICCTSEKISCDVVLSGVRSAYPHTPFIFIEGNNYPVNLKTKQLNKIEFISSSFKEDELLQKVEQLLTDKNIPQQNGKYLPVHISLLEKMFTVGVSLYIQLNENKYVKVLNENAAFDKEASDRFRRKKLDYLYIELIDIKIFISSLRKNLLSAVDWKTVDIDTALENVTTDWSLVLASGNMSGWTESVKDLAKQNVAIAIELMKRNTNLKKVIDKLNLRKINSKASMHSYTLAFVCTCILKELGWNSPITVQKMVFACLLHDMELNETMFENMLNLIADDKLNSELHLQTNYYILNHPKTAANFVRSWTSCPADVDTLILQHHEKLDATGFPNKLNFLNIFPLAGVLIIAEDVLFFKYSNPGKSPIEYLLNKVEYYNRGDFKKIYAATLKILQENRIS